MSKAASQALGKAASPAAAEAGANPLVADVARLAPSSGIQFIDFTIPAPAVAAMLARYVEERDEADGALLIPLVEGADGDGVEWHPVTGEQLPSGASLWVTGHQAIEPFLDSWVPLPYFRFLGRRDGSELRFDEGPVDWVRLYMARPADGLREADEIRAVIAVDTRIAELSRVDQRDYLAPNMDDVVFAPVFRLACDVTHLDAFLGAPWVDTWLSARLDDHRRRSTGQPAAGQAPFALEHLARYLTLLRLLDQAAPMPHLQFLDTRSAHWRHRRSGVDLMLDLDSTDTAALLRTGAAAGAGVLPDTVGLRLRELSRPTECHSGPIDTLVEFARADFGDARSARLSGRTDAFAWPSLVRVGKEARRLSQRPSAAPGETGLHGLVRGICDLQPHPSVWRFARETQEAETARASGTSGSGRIGSGLSTSGTPAGGSIVSRFARSGRSLARPGGAVASEPGRMVSGPLLAHLAEDGSLLAGSAAAPALRPHFSPAALTKMFIAECLLHAITAVGEPRAISASGRVRQITRLVMAAPPAATPEERSALEQRAREAVDLVWTALGWNSAALAPPRPDVVLSLDRGLGAQLLYLHDEIEARHAGAVRAFVSMTAGQAPPGDELSPPPAMTTPHTGPTGINIAALDLAAHVSSLSVADYALGGEGGLRPRITFSDRSAIGGDSLLGVVVKDVILPAIAAALRSAGHPDATALLFRLGQPRARHDTEAGPHFASRFLRRVLQPAAMALVDRHAASRDGPLSATLSDLVACADGRLDPLDAQLEEIAAAEGARAFRLADVAVSVRRRDLSRIITAHLEPLVERTSAVLRATRSDILLLTGRYARLEEVYRLFDRELPIAPHRILDMGARVEEMVRHGRARGLPAQDAGLGGLLGTALGGQPGEGAQRVALIADELQRLTPPPAAGILNGHAIEGAGVPFLSSAPTAAAVVDPLQGVAGTFAEQLALALAEVAERASPQHLGDTARATAAHAGRITAVSLAAEPGPPAGGRS